MTQPERRRGKSGGGSRNGTKEGKRKEGKEEQGEREENLGASLASGLLGTADSLRGYFKV